MKIIAAFLIAVFNFTGSKATPNHTDSIPVNQKDVESIDAIINSLYSVISGPAGEKRT